MDIYTAIAARKSVRAFQDREVPEELLLRFLEAARLAPSACNFQEWRFVVVRNPETRKRLAIAANKQMFTLCAVAEGLGTCWIGAFDEGKVKEILSICQIPVL